MTSFSKLYCASTLSLLLGSTSAFADVTNEQVWGNWQGYMETMGYTISAHEATSGSILTVTDIKMAMTQTKGGEDVTATLPSLTFTEQGDGSVKISLPRLSEIAVDLALETGEEIDALVSYTQDGLNMIATGEGGNFEYAYSANGIDLKLEELNYDGSDIGLDFANVNVSLKDVTGLTTISDGAIRNITQNLNTAALTYDVAFADPENDGRAKIKGTLNNLGTNSTSMVPRDGLKMLDLNAMLEAGTSGSGTIIHEGGDMDLAFSSRDGAGTITSSSDSGAINFSLNPDGISYDVSQTNFAVNALMPNVPLPIVMNMAESKFNLKMPLRKSDAEQDFALGIKMGDFTISDMIWGMFDPTGNLPRDPATLALDLTGKAKILFNFLDPDQAAALDSSGATPGELNALTLKKLVVDAVGARLTGTGDFTFDNTDLASFGGMPRPEGAVNLKLVGGNGLLDNLVSMGMLPQQQAMGARMMMGLFAVAGPEPDTLNSKIEINNAGHILANGQRIQ